ncbi:MAG: hypothetical protein GF317_23180 [Candidatus Lokiarchaeota archaeon]|nr:hypothetical protein [Candidatus Lokiarchaeota archaeon]
MSDTLFDKDLEISIDGIKRFKYYKITKRIINVELTRYSSNNYLVSIYDKTPNSKHKIELNNIIANPKILNRFFIAIKEKQDPGLEQNIPLIILESLIKQNEIENCNYETYVHNYKDLLFFKLFKIIEKDKSLKEAFEKELGEFNYDSVIEYWDQLDFLTPISYEERFESIILEIQMLKSFFVITKYIEYPLKHELYKKYEK